MIEITRLHRPYGIEMKGHAGAALNGQEHDLVCCAASTLVQTLLYSMGRQSHAIDVVMQEGYAMIRCEDNYRCDREMAQTFRVVEDGLEMLAAAYPECMRFTE